MKTSEIVYTGFGYSASWHPKIDTLIVTREKGGKALAGKEGHHWVEAIRTAIDSREAADLCRAIYNN